MKNKTLVNRELDDIWEIVEMYSMLAYGASQNALKRFPLICFNSKIPKHFVFFQIIQLCIKYERNFFQHSKPQLLQNQCKSIQ